MEKKDFLEKVLNKKIINITPLIGGMMNESFLVETIDKKYVYYIPTEQANEMVNRQLEKDDQEKTYHIGITSKNIYFDVNSGIKINEYIDGVSLDKADSFDYQQVAALLHVLHDSNIQSSEDYHPFERFLNYEKEMLSFHTQDDELYKFLRNFIFSKREYLSSLEKDFSHNDFQKSNIIKGKEYKVIDFEFTGNNHYLYDVACFANGDVEEGEKLLEAYINKPSQKEYEIFYLWRILISLQWRNVALIKHYRNQGEKHGYNFLEVAKHFITNAQCAYNKLITKGKE